MKLKDRVAVITGSASGIGRASAPEFAKEGAKVVVADINLSGARETVWQIESAAGVAVPVEADVSVPESVQELVEKTIQSFGNVHVLFNNAAIQVNKTVEDTTFEEWNREIGVNLGGVFLCSKFFLPHLCKSKGCIVNMASVNGFFVEPSCAAYCATKGGIIALTKAMAIDQAKME
jgi:NAD(P)-dependent dehydrogenase (short-subunit alcohol dehydrogenase family)